MKNFYYKCLNFIKKYDFPIHFFIGYDILLRSISKFFSTLYLKIILKTLGCQYGKGLSVHGKPIVRSHSKGSIKLGNNIKLNSAFSSTLAGITNPVILSCIENGKITIGNNSGLTSTVISSNILVEIGDNVKIGANTKIYDHDFHSLNYNNRRDPYLDRQDCRSIPVFIGNDVFIGANAIILKGVTIGDRTIVGAGAVITKQIIPQDSIVAGNPAKIIKKCDSYKENEKIK